MTIVNRRKKVIEGIAKHKPGGQDHDQDNHGRKGPGRILPTSRFDNTSGYETRAKFRQSIGPWSGAGWHGAARYGDIIPIAHDGALRDQGSFGMLGEGIYASFGPSGFHHMSNGGPYDVGPMSTRIKMSVQVDLDNALIIETDTTTLPDREYLFEVLTTELGGGDFKTGMEMLEDEFGDKSPWSDLAWADPAPQRFIMEKLGLDGVVLDYGDNHDAYMSSWGSQVVVLDESKIRITGFHGKAPLSLDEGPQSWGDLRDAVGHLEDVWSGKMPEGDLDSAIGNVEGMVGMEYPRDLLAMTLNDIRMSKAYAKPTRVYTWEEFYSLLPKRIAKHTPGGVEHDQMNHGLRGKSGTHYTKRPSSEGQPGYAEFKQLVDLKDPTDAESDKLMEHFAQFRAANNEWQKQIQYGMTMGDITLEEAEGLGYIGYTENWGELPPTMYHTTTAKDAIYESGALKTRGELAGPEGLGGGPDDTISLTVDKTVADAIKNSMLEMREVLDGTVTPEMLLARAKAGDQGSDPFLNTWMNANAKKGTNATDNAAKMLAQIETNSWRNDSFITSLTPEQALEKIRANRDDPGATNAVGVPNENFTAPDGQFFNFTYTRGPDAVIEAKADMFKGFLAYREFSGGPLDPLFWGFNPKEFMTLDPSQIEVIEVKPKPNTFGQQIGGMKEVRVFTGDALEVVQPVAKHTPGGVEHDQKDHGRRRNARYLGPFPGQKVAQTTHAASKFHVMYDPNATNGWGYKPFTHKDGSEVQLSMDDIERFAGDKAFASFNETLARNAAKHGVDIAKIPERYRTVFQSALDRYDLLDAEGAKGIWQDATDLPPWIHSLRLDVNRLNARAWSGATPPFVSEVSNDFNGMVEFGDDNKWRYLPEAGTRLAEMDDFYNNFHRTIFATAEETGFGFDQGAAVTALISPQQKAIDNLAGAVDLMQLTDSPRTISGDIKEKVIFRLKEQQTNLSEGGVKDGYQQERFDELATALDMLENSNDLTGRDLPPFAHLMVINEQRRELTGGKGFGASAGWTFWNDANLVLRGDVPADAITGVKRRSFANNMIDPNDEANSGDITVDFHMMNAGSFMLGGDKASSNLTSGKVSGVAVGLRALYADGMRQVLSEHDGSRGIVAASHMQQVLWAEWQRGTDTEANTFTTATGEVHKLHRTTGKGVTDAG